MVLPHLLLHPAQELHLAYNSVSDLSQLSMLDQLQVLDVEGNDVDDLVQVQNLAFCSRLHSLSLQGNPVCVQPHPTASQVPEAPPGGGRDSSWVWVALWESRGI